MLQRGGAEIELTIRRLYVSNNVTISLAFEWSLWEERKERKGEEREKKEEKRERKRGREKERKREREKREKERKIDR